MQPAPAAGFSFWLLVCTLAGCSGCASGAAFGGAQSATASGVRPAACPNVRAAVLRVPTRPL
jgi:hypothetical protein